MSDFARGSSEQAPFSITRLGQADINAAITICYEDIFGGELASRIGNSEKPVHLLINMTNLAWFGKSQASSQQLRLSQLRSLETGLPALRATNTGITSVLGPDGKSALISSRIYPSKLEHPSSGLRGQNALCSLGKLPYFEYFLHPADLGPDSS
jgi:apolipoprotein N-acyltransferase